jgi:3-hydroxyisobutyrate dehydrogenase-like beta-hydroxyacid dehydrogenase
MSLFDAFGYSGKRALVVGGATGMGAAVAEAVRDAGAEVVVMDRSKITVKGVQTIAVDLAEKASIDKALAELSGKFDALFSCAGVADGTPGIERINFIGHRYMIDRLLAADMLPRGSAIGFISSAAGMGWEANLPQLTEFLKIDDWDEAVAWVKEQGKADYMFSKQAICAYVAQQALPLLKRGVRINAILPGPTDTPLAQANKDRWLGFGADYRKEANVEVSTSLDQALPLVFLCSAAAKAISGITVISDIGFTSSAVAESFPSAKMTVNFLRGVGGATGGVSPQRASAVAKAAALKVKPETRMLIDGKLVEADNKGTFANINPATEEKLGDVANGTHSDMHRAIAAARRAFDTTNWSTDREFRKHCLGQLQKALEDEREELREQLILEAGCPLPVRPHEAWERHERGRVAQRRTVPSPARTGRTASRGSRRRGRTGARPGTVVLVHSTVSHDTLHQLVKAATERGVLMLDAPVSGARGHLSVGNLAVMVGGEAEAFARAKPVMETYGGLVLHLGASGAGLDAKLSINMYRYLCMAAGQEATRLAESAGVGAAMAQLVAHAECNRYVGNATRQYMQKNVPFAAREKDAVLAQKDLRAAIARAAEVGVELPSAELAVSLMHLLFGAEPGAPGDPRAGAREPSTDTSSLPNQAR